MPLHLTCSRTIDDCVQMLRKGETLSVVTEKRRKKITITYVPEVTTLHFSTDTREGRILFVDGLVVETTFKYQTLCCVTTVSEHKDKVCFTVYSKRGCSGYPMSNLSGAMKSYCEAAKEKFTGSENGKSIFGITKLPVQAILRAFYADQLASEGLLEAFVLPSLKHIDVVTRPWEDETSNALGMSSVRRTQSNNLLRKRPMSDQKDNDIHSSKSSRQLELECINLIVSEPWDASVNNDMQMDDMPLFKQHPIPENSWFGSCEHERLSDNAQLTMLNATNDFSMFSFLTDAQADDELSKLFDGLIDYSII